jgi:hypothetical protein
LYAEATEAMLESETAKDPSFPRFADSSVDEPSITNDVFYKFGSLEAGKIFPFAVATVASSLEILTTLNWCAEISQLANPSEL